MQGHTFKHKGLTFSYLDSGGNGQIIIVLHAHWMEGITFAPFAAALAPTWRVIALDQRGHGDSDHATSYSREDYVGDLKAFFDHLQITEPVVLLGNSLGGINSYQFSARYPHLVRSMIIEDIGVAYAGDMSFCLSWAGLFKTREELIAQIAPHFLSSLQDSFRETPEGWRLAFDPKDMILSNNGVKCDLWHEWLATDCPTLLLRGKESRVTTQEHMEEMAARRPNTYLKVLEGGHVLHIDNSLAFTEVVRAFLKKH